MAAGTIAANGEIGDQADGHPGIGRGLLGVRQTLGGEPLQKQMKIDFMPMRFGEGFDFRAARIAQRLGPVAPVTLTVFLCQLHGLQAV
ncbi:hypothetical protein QMO17_31775, partial [Klebsiella pneumoniae]|nr:hypothetical protein [Klebsiella pneumoniae]